MISFLIYTHFQLHETQAHYPLHLVKVKDHIIASGGFLSVVAVKGYYIT